MNPDTTVMEYHSALVVVNNWRSSHNWPLNGFQTTLRQRARKIDSAVLISQRLKRLKSIETKLQRFPNMELSQMQDLGGCRAVVRDVACVRKLAALYEQSDAKNKHRHVFVKKYDYLVKPKSDGYRGIHLVYKYRSKSPFYAAFNGHRIEVQLRSKLQHAWATAVETVDTFTGQALKSSAGDKRWARFFVLMGNALAFREKTSLVAGAPSDRKVLKAELLAIAEELRVEATLNSWRVALQHVEAGGVPDADLFLVVFDINEWSVNVIGFADGDIKAAAEKYIDVEKEIADGAKKQAVLVGLESLAALRKAYPSYYADTGAFISAMRRAIY